MKKTLLLITLFTTFINFGQTPITDFFSIPMSNYTIVESVPPIDESASGANLTWNFTNLATTGVTTLDTYAAPTPAELSNYPGTTEVLTITDSGAGTNKIFAKDMAGAFSLTGADTGDIELNYSGDNALIGTFPLSYNYNNTDNVSGTFSGLASGTFSGTITTTVDAYGTLNLNDVGNGAYSGSVTRLKTVQNVNLSIGFPVGTAVQTSYYYYDNSTDNLMFRSNTVAISIPIAGINQTTTLLESFIGITLSINDVNMVSSEIQIFPNPVEDELTIKLNNTSNITAIFVTDLNGRVIISRDAFQERLDTSILQSGMYLLSVETEAGLITKKFLKK